MADEYRDHRWVPWVSYGVAGLISASRVGLGRHFLSDVLFGAVLGHSLGRMVTTRERGVEPGALDRLQPIYDPRDKTYGLTDGFAW